MSLEFFKYHGTGNDFIIIDNRDFKFPKENVELVSKLCHRRFGIGADGLILLENADLYHFSMVYYNSDGNQSTMCGNGGRCIAAFANKIYTEINTLRFLACDGEHQANILSKSNDLVAVNLKMNNVNNIEKVDNGYYLNTGSPHFVTFTNELRGLDVYNLGRSIRYNERFARKGTNVDFVELFDDYIYVRTYERGVEDETYSCGTGVVASAIISDLTGFGNNSEIKVKTNGGELKVKFDSKDKTEYNNIWLEGPTKLVFKGEISGIY